MTQSVEQNMANALRVLSVDCVEAANSGHPGLPLGAADIATVLFKDFLRFNPQQPHWPNRDRFILSAGHGSALLYSLLHLTGYADFDTNTLKNFRKIGSYAAGHPEYGHGAGIETTTGPLGQGIATAVGLALGERLANARHGDSLVNHYTYVLASDGDLMEGISHEAAGLAGHLQLNKLIVLWDDNRISIDGSTDLSSSDDNLARFAAYGWHTLAVDGHNHAAIHDALTQAQQASKPVLIACRTIIGYGAPSKSGTCDVHGSPLGAAESAALRTALQQGDVPFVVNAQAAAAWQQVGQKSAAQYAQWLHTSQSPQGQALTQALQQPWQAQVTQLLAQAKEALQGQTLATRAASQQVLNILVPAIDALVGGSADLTPSNNTRTKTMTDVQAGNYAGNYLRYGIREHGMAAAMNGLALYGGFVPYGGTFMVFSDYMRPAMRLSALMGTQVVYVLTHDSIGLGEDGPTHQPVEHLATLRAIPNLTVFRPADGIETAEAWALALQHKGPSVLALSRQNLPPARLTADAQNLTARGAYVLREAVGVHTVTLVASGSEVMLALKAQDILQQQGVGARVVSVPCFELFAQQDAVYRAHTIPAHTVRVGVEAAIRQGWDALIGDGPFVGMSSFGASGAAASLYEHFNITPQAIATAALHALNQANGLYAAGEGI